MDPISIAFGLAQFAPQIIRWITGSDKAADAAGAVVDIAETVTGRKGSDALDALKADPALVLQFRQSVIAQEADLDKAYLADRADARKRDAVFISSGTRNYRADVMFFLAVLMIAGLVWLVWKDPRLYTFLEDVKANVTQANPIEALRAIALDALLLAQELENGQERSDSDEG